VQRFAKIDSTDTACEAENEAECQQPCREVLLREKRADSPEDAKKKCVEYPTLTLAEENLNEQKR
jgi:hypothetical protein